MVLLLTLIEAAGGEVSSLPPQFKSSKKKEIDTKIFLNLIEHIVFINWLIYSNKFNKIKLIFKPQMIICKYLADE
tara:strand:+ start:1560 stop:1784 length:225 start_codon:yes stop_codon:yes gene_type:complete